MGICLRDICLMGICLMGIYLIGGLLDQNSWEELLDRRFFDQSLRNWYLVEVYWLEFEVRALVRIVIVEEGFQYDRQFLLEGLFGFYQSCKQLHRAGQKLFAELGEP